MQSALNWQGNHFLKTATFMGCALLALFTACARPPTKPFSPASPEPESTRTSPSASPVIATIPAVPSVTFKPVPSQTPTELPLDFWQKIPVIPERISGRTREIYQNGLAMGNQPQIFSRIGDCASAAPAFLVGFDNGYKLGDYASLAPAIDYFQGSFKRPSLAAKAGLNSAGLLTSLWTPRECQPGESLLDCQYRLDQPGFAFIAIGTNDGYYEKETPGSFEKNMRLILDDTIARGIVPILGTKADDVEGDGSINATIARLALEYQVPLWNFWRAVQPLPNHGMVAPEHLSTISYKNFTDFSMPDSLQYGMQMRNLTALQMLDFLRQQLAEEP
jgi:hypothetical protein